MLLVFWIVLFVAGACLILLMPSIWGKQIYDAYRGNRRVNCPETHSPVSVRFNALQVAMSGLSGQPRLRLAACSRWPMRADCGQDCIPDAARTQPLITLRSAQPVAQRLARLPVLVAAAVAWVLGMAWHSQYVFRAQWAAALGLNHRQTLDLARMWTPHLMTVAACLLFAYAVAWITNRLGPRSIFRSTSVALALWLVIVAAVLAATRAMIPHDLLWIEGLYTLLATLLVGTIVGGLPRRVFIKDSE